VQDLAFPDGQSFRCLNVAGGCWVSFPVRGDADNPITVSVSYNDVTQVAAVMALAFDPYYDRQTLLSYTVQGLLTLIQDGQGNQVNQTFNPDGTLASRTNARGFTTFFYYEDPGRQSALKAEVRVMNAGAYRLSATAAQIPVGLQMAHQIILEGVVSIFTATNSRNAD
jgi:hypothetical protein